MARFACIGDYLYTIDDNSLSTFNISDSSKIVPTSRISANWSRIETIFPKDSLLFLGSMQGMYIYNLKNPAKPEFVYLYRHVVSCDPVVVQGRYAYVTLRTDFSGNSCSRGFNQLEVIDVKTLTNPRNVGTYTMQNPRGLGIDGATLFVCDGMDLLVMDASNANPGLPSNSFPSPLRVPSGAITRILRFSSACFAIRNASKSTSPRLMGIAFHMVKSLLKIGLSQVSSLTNAVIGLGSKWVYSKGASKKFT
jgi:hypothetical protein